MQTRRQYHHTHQQPQVQQRPQLDPFQAMLQAQTAHANNNHYGAAEQSLNHGAASPSGTNTTQQHPARIIPGHSSDVIQQQQVHAMTPPRRRINTAETEVIHNGGFVGGEPASPLHHQHNQGDAAAAPSAVPTSPQPAFTEGHFAVPPSNRQQHAPVQEVDDTMYDDLSVGQVSTISGLSMDDDSLLVAQRMAGPLPPIEEHTQRAVLPPLEVAVPSAKKKVQKAPTGRPPKTLTATSAPLSAARRGKTRFDDLITQLAVTQGSIASPRSTPVQRPYSLSRSFSAPSTPTSVPGQGTYPKLAAPSLMSPRQFMISRHPDPFVARVVDSVAGSTTGSGSGVGDPSTDALLQGRRRRHWRSASTGTLLNDISVGSFVGQSTAPTALLSSSSGSLSTAPSVRKGMKTASAAQQMMRKYTGADDAYTVPSHKKKNPVKEELKYLLGKVGTPIRNMPLLKPKPPKLQRSSGTLT